MVGVPEEVTVGPEALRRRVLVHHVDHLQRLLPGADPEVLEHGASLHLVVEAGSTEQHPVGGLLAVEHGVKHVQIRR